MFPDGNGRGGKVLNFNSCHKPYITEAIATGTTKLPKEWTPPFLRADFNIALTGLSQKKYMGYQHISNISDRYYKITTDWKRILTEESSCVCKEMFINYLLSTI